MNTNLKKHVLNSNKTINNINFVDLLVVGCGIGGLELSKQVKTKWNTNNTMKASIKDSKKSILIVDQSDYIGGRVITVNDKYKGRKISFEAGAARFNKHHKSLISVIERCGLKNDIAKIPSYWEFIPTEKYKKKLEKIPFKNVEDLLNKLVSHYDKAKFKKYLHSVNLYEACRDLYNIDVADFLKHSYGYYSEILIFNAFNAIRSLKNDLSETNQFYVLKNGLSQVPLCIANDVISNNDNDDVNVNIALRIQVGFWSYDNETKLFKVNILNLNTNKKSKIICKNLVLATHGKQLKRWKSQLNRINPQILNVMSHVSSEPLLRTYAIYDSKWFKNYGKVVTDGLVKYVIPINYDLGLIMISYTDGEYCRKMMKHINNGTQEEAIYNSLKEIFPNEQIEKKPKYLRNEYWETGAVYWNKGADSNKMSKFMMKPSKHHNLFICGDSFSENQAWTDGAIYNAREVSKLI